jgi:para-aminobenzoate synthetase
MAGGHPLLILIGNLESGCRANVNLADITVVAPAHPDVARQTAEALAQFPAFDHLLGQGAGNPAATLLCVREDLHPAPEAVFGELFGQSSHCVWLDSSNAASDARADRNRYSIMADDGGSHGRRARHLRGVTVMESELLSLRVPGPFFAWLDRNWHRNRQLVTDLRRAWASRWDGSVIWDMS